MNAPRRQKGVAIITAILVATLASVAAYALTAELQLDIQRSANLIDSDQARLYVQGSEAWIKSILAEDKEKTEFDHYAEPWAITLSPIALEGGQLTGAIEDMQGRFNLNSLANTTQGSEDQGEGQTIPYQRFTRLLELLEIDPALAQAVTDWIDENVEPTPPLGAEDGYYLGLTPPYRTANRAMASASELRLVKGVDDEIFNKLAPFISALPGDPAINVNTAPAEVLAALNPEISIALAGRIVERRDSVPYESPSDFTGDPLLEGIAVNPQGLGVKSDYFMVRSEARIGAGRIRSSSLLSREGDKGVRVILRSLGQE
jgi:general secretion pathway protein K